MSAKKRTSLDAVFAAEEFSAPILPRKGRGASKQEGRAEAAPPGNQPPERGGEPRHPKFKQHTAYLPLAVHEQLRRLAFEENRKMHDYLVEGLDRVFADRGLPAVGDIS